MTLTAEHESASSISREQTPLEFVFRHEHIDKALAWMADDINNWRNVAGRDVKNVPANSNWMLENAEILEYQMTILRTQERKCLLSKVTQSVKIFFENLPENPERRHEAKAAGLVYEFDPNIIHYAYLLRQHPRGHLLTWALTLLP